MPDLIKSTLAYIRQPDGNYIPVFYVNTADDVYIDIEKSMTLGSMINDGTIRNQIYNVDNDTQRFALTVNEVKLHDMVNVYSSGSLYEVVDITKLSSEDGYNKIVIKDSESMPLTVVTDSILDTALNASDDTISHYMLRGDLYTGNDLPEAIYRFSSATIFRRYNVPSVILWGGPSGTSMAIPMINHYISQTQTWTGWSPLGMTSSDRSKLDVLFTKGPTVLSANPSRVVYVDPVNGLDTNTGLTTALSMQTIKGAIAKYGGVGNLNIRLADGEYTDSSVLTINGVTRLVINGNTTDNSKVIIKFPIYTSDIPIYIDGVTFDVSAFPADQYTSSDNPYAALFRGSTFSVTNSIVIGPGLGPNSAIIGRNSSMGYISACDFSNWNIAVRSESHSNVYCTRVTTSGDVNLTYSSVGSTIEYTEDASTPIQIVHAKNTSGIIIVDGVSTSESEIKSLIRKDNLLHNWDFSNPYIPTSGSLVGIGTFLGRWKSVTAGNVLSISQTGGLLYSTTTANGYIQQLIKSSLVNLHNRGVIFSVAITSLPVDASILIHVLTRNANNEIVQSDGVAITGTDELSSTILSCPLVINRPYVTLECRITNIVPDKTVVITKAKLEISPISTLALTDAADKAEQAVNCRVTSVDGEYIGGNSVIASASVG